MDRKIFKLKNTRLIFLLSEEADLENRQGKSCAADCYYAAVFFGHYCIIYNYQSTQNLKEHSSNLELHWHEAGELAKEILKRMIKTEVADAKIT